MTGKKYKQEFIPQVRIIVRHDLAKYIKKTYRENVQGKVVINRHLKMPIRFNAVGGAELAYGGSLSPKKAALVQCLPEMLEHAEYNNWGQRDADDAPSVIGYMNFKAKVIINGQEENVRITAQFKEGGKLYYNHEVNTIRIDKKKVPSCGRD